MIHISFLTIDHGQHFSLSLLLQKNMSEKNMSPYIFTSKLKHLRSAPVDRPTSYVQGRLRSAVSLSKYGVRGSSVGGVRQTGGSSSPPSVATSVPHIVIKIGDCRHHQLFCLIALFFRQKVQTLLQHLHDIDVINCRCALRPCLRALN